MNSWLITGGAGFIRTNFDYPLASEPEVNIVVFDALDCAGNVDNRSALLDTGRINFFYGDIRGEGFVRPLFERDGFERTVHPAADSQVDRSIGEPSGFVTDLLLIESFLGCGRLARGE